MYATNKKTHMKNHMNRKNPCKIHKDGIFLTDTIKTDVLNCDYKHIQQNSHITPPDVKEKHETTICNNNTYLTHTIIHQQCNILTHQDLVSMVLPHVKSLKYGQSKVFDRLNTFQQHVEDEQHIDHKDVLTMTNDITQTRDVQTLTDAYYSFNKVNRNYVRRIDGVGKHDWTWQPCDYEDILTEIVEQLKEYVFVAYEVKLNNHFMENRESSQLINFYKINKYFLIKPRCVSARHDNQALFFNTDEEYDEHPGTIELCDELNKFFDNTIVDPWEMKEFLDKIKHLIQSNAETTYNMIEKLVCNVGDIVIPS
jgi:hypothetical protein